MFLSSSQQFNVDVWFCYGSFFYGFESIIYDATTSSMKLIPKVEQPEEAADLYSFLESIIDKPKGLIKVELRVFCPEKIKKKYKFSNPVHLFTDIVPKIHGYELGLPIIDFGLPRGLSYSCTDLWTQLLAGVWKVR